MREKGLRLNLGTPKKRFGLNVGLAVEWARIATMDRGLRVLNSDLGLRYFNLKEFLVSPNCLLISDGPV